MEKWRMESNSFKQIAVSIVCTFIGLVLAYGCRNFDGLMLTNTLAGFLLGILLLLIGITGILTAGKKSIEIDPGIRRITIEDSNVFRTET